MRDPELAFDKLARLKDAGVRIAIDDFGAGYSSLSYLKQLPASLLKIDRAFVANLPEDQGNAILIKAIFGLARSFGLQILGEGVESKAQIDYLADLDCDYFQGYYYGRPMPPEDFHRWAV